jgi:type IV pilus assembly protein PilW
MNQRAVTIRARYEGFTIVEIMIAMTLSLLLIAGILSVVYSSKITYLENERVGRNQEGGRAAFEMILRDLRGAGFPGCAQPIGSLVQLHNLLANPTSLLWRFDVPLQGYEGSSGTWSPTLDTVLSTATPAPSSGNDVIVIRTVRAGQPEFRTTGQTNPTADIVVSKRAGQKVAAGTGTFVINDCAAESFFAATTTGADADTTATLTRNTGGSAPTNQSTDLQWSFNPGALVLPVDTVIYYIAPSATPAVQGNQAGPALWRIVSSVGTPEEVIPGVEKMEIQYGVDTNGDTVVDQYSNADTVDAASNWGNVISVRVAILVRSPEANSPEVDKRTYTLLIKSVGPFNDHYERSLFTTTVTLRNRTT